MNEERQPNTGELTDEEILTLSLVNPDHFAVLIRRYEAAFLLKVKSVIGEREEASDIVVETFSKIYFNASKFEKQENASFKSWAYRILLNTTFTEYQKLKKGRERFTQLDPEVWDIIPDTKFNFNDLTNDYVHSVLVRLPVKMARALRLHYIEGYSQEEIAVESGESVSAIKTRIHRAKEAFRNIDLTI